MTLGIGDHVVKLDSKGDPLMDANPQKESYVEFEIVDLSPSFSARNPDKPNTAENWDTLQFAKLRKVR